MQAAVLGLGNISTRHRRNIKYLWPQCKVYAAPTQSRALDSPPSNCDRYFCSSKELPVGELDFVVIATPATRHLELAIPFIEAGVPVLIEKPLTSSVSELKKFESYIKATGSDVYVAYCLRFLSLFKEAKEIIEQGKLGDILYVSCCVGQFLPDWRPGSDYRNSVSAQASLGGGVLLELSHEVDYLQELFGALRVQWADIHNTGSLDIDAEDCANVVFSSELAPHISLHLDFLQKTPSRLLTVVGTEASMCWDLMQKHLTVNRRNKLPEVIDEKYDDGNQMYKDMLSSFVDKSHPARTRLADFNSASSTIKTIEQIKQFWGAN
ncbi:Gfo/Idh/MocA family protein [Planctobacterium marinum]|uniref:Gfo/Idh/MocA family protein n=1 Tax=Planctobacterium marinum TaxID=1631968 RepID=UPI001E3B682F|nr:Gfo/Idh/MocA family oxidoreductase [Planctobacterium marinum]MCC2606134.1 Gfo/Idh/MocA family oxidoreductase [Planctobacterium marinum]